MIETTASQSEGTFEYTKTRIVSVPSETLRENRVVMGVYNDPRADIFRVLRTNVLQQLRENRWNTFAITSAAPGAGKSFVSVNLALAIALEGNQSVLIVDADLRNPNVGNYFNLQNDFGLIDYLKGLVSIEETLINPGVERLVVLPGRNATYNFSELLSSQRMVNLIQDIKTRYESRVIIFDIPPLFMADDALLFMSYIDAALFIVEDGKTTADELRESMHILEQTNLLGIVLNKSTQPVPRYQYGQMYESEKGRHRAE